MYMHAYRIIYDHLEDSDGVHYHIDGGDDVVIDAR